MAEECKRLDEYDEEDLHNVSLDCYAANIAGILGVALIFYMFPDLLQKIKETLGFS